MKGLRIKVHVKQFEIAMPGGSCGVVMSQCRGKANISVLGTTTEFYEWYRSDLSVGDCISIEFAEISSPMIPDPVPDEPDEKYIESLLKEYEMLKKDLSAEGLIDANE